MNALARTATNTAAKFWIHLVCASLGAVLVTWLVVNWFFDGHPDRWLVALVVFAIWLFTLMVIIGLFLLNRSNRRFRQCAYEIHQMSHIYRDVLANSLTVAPKLDKDQQDRLLLSEKEVLKNICVKIVNVFTNLIGRKCMVTVRLMAEEGGKKFCFTWATSEEDIYRTGLEPDQCWVAVGENTDFDKVYKATDSGRSFFHAADLKKLKEYRSQRRGWQKLYQSEIIVPIRHAVKNAAEHNVLGFLCVDTRSTYRLNDTYHVEFLSAFADQMFSYLSIVRQSYSPGMMGPLQGAKNPQS